MESLENFWPVWKVLRQSGKFPDSLESFQTVWKVSGQSGKFLDRLETFQTAWKVSGQSGNFPDSLERLFGQCGNFPDSLETFRIVWKLFGQFGKFPDSLESFRTVWKVSWTNELTFPSSLFIPCCRLQFLSGLAGSLLPCSPFWSQWRPFPLWYRNFLDCWHTIPSINMLHCLNRTV